jgi:hypothetical protein
VSPDWRELLVLFSFGAAPFDSSIYHVHHLFFNSSCVLDLNAVLGLWLCLVASLMARCLRIASASDSRWLKSNARVKCVVTSVG